MHPRLLHELSGLRCTVSANNADANAQLFDCLEVFYNQRRRHSAAGPMSAAAFERRMTQA
jgi:hypothetical protein